MGRDQVGSGRSAPRFCRSCGATAPTTGRFCPSCGSSLNLTSPYPAPDNSRTGPPAADRFRTDARPASADVYPQTGVVTPSVAGSMRMGFGIAAGFVLFMLVVVAALAIAYLLTNSDLTWPLARKASVFAGTGPADSSVMPMGGTYTIEWAAQPTSPTACRINATLRPQADPSSYRTLVESFVSEVRQPAAITGFVVPARSDYFVRVESDCSWSLRFVEE